MCDTENLITAVEKYPCLWNVSHESYYHDRDLKDLAWEQVCLEIIKDWDSTSDEEKKKKCAETKKKWNNVRDCYRRDINKVKRTPTGSGSTKVKKYVYTDLLTFLAPILLSRRHEGNYDDGGDEISTDGSSRQEEESQTGQTLFVQNHIPEETPNNAKKAKVTKKDVPTQILEIMKQRKEQPVDDDDDTKFLLSFRTDMKTMNRSQKMDFKIGMLQLVKQTFEPPRNVYFSNSSHSCSTSQSPQPMFSPISPNHPQINHNRSSISHRPTYTNLISPYNLPQQPPQSSPPQYSQPQNDFSENTDDGNLQEFLQFRNNQ